MEERTFKSVLKNTYSVAQLYRRLDLLQRFFEHFFFDTTSREGDRAQLFLAYYRHADPDTARHAEAMTGWGAQVFELFTADNVYERVRELKEAAARLPSLTLYVPVHLPSIQQEPIGIWCRAYVHSDIMLDIKIDPDTVGGCAFAYNNSFHDLSFSYFAAKERAALVKLANTYDV